MRKKAEIKLPEDFRGIIIGEMGQGASIIEVIVKLGITRSAHYRLMAENSEYEKAFEEGLEKSEAWWLKTGREFLTGEVKKFNSGLWFMNMKNRFGWRDTPLPAGEKGTFGGKDAEGATVEKYRLVKEGKDDVETIN
jgi:hypothetical protein